MFSVEFRCYVAQSTTSMHAKHTKARGSIYCAKHNQHAKHTKARGSTGAYSQEKFVHA